MGKWRAETDARTPRPKDGNARNCPPETGARQPNPREDKRFSQTRKNQPRDRTAWLGKQDSNQSMHFTCIAFSLRKTRAKLRRARSGEFAARNSMLGEGAPVVIPTRFTEDVRADFRVQNRLDFRRIVRIGVVMGWPSRTDARKVELAQIPSPIGLAIGAANPAEIDIAIVAEIIAARHKGSGAVF